MLRKIKTWHIVLVIIFVSEAITALMNALLSRLWWGEVSVELIKIGAIDSLVNCLFIVPPASYVISKLSTLYIEHDFLRHEITEKKQAEKELKVKEKAIASSISGIVISDQVGFIKYANDSATRMWGYSDEREVAGKFAGNFIRDKHRAYEIILELYNKGHWIGELVARRKDGSLFDVELVATLVRDDEKNPLCMMVSCLDVTDRNRAEEERRKLQAQLLHAQKLESVGRLAGGIAHDFKNVLTAIIGHAELLLTEFSRDNKDRSKLESIVRAGERASSLVQQLLALSRQQELDMRVVDLNGIINNISQMLRWVMGEDVALELRKVQGPLNIVADSGQIEQVLMNLAVNARDAMPRGGRLAIETRRMEAARTFRNGGDGLMPGPCVLLSVSDNGQGMSSEVKDRIFEPFFSTKEKGKGTGLGLATVYGIIKQHNGHIEVESEPGRGACFRIYIPASEEETIAPESTRCTSLPQGNETVLIVEDDTDVRSFVTETLKLLGYRILSAQSGSEALGVSDTFDGKIDVLLTDVVMPGMSGRKLSDVFSSRRPDSKILFMSAYSEDNISGHGHEPYKSAFIQKPVTPSKLAVKLREVLGSKLS
jgi:PAS domain S-box-containing protein